MTISVWNIADGKLERELKEHKGEIWAVCQSSDGNWAFSGGSDKEIIKWNMESGTVAIKFLGHADRIRDLKMSDDNRYLYSCSNDNTVRAWCIETSEPLKTFKQRGQAFSHTKWIPAIVTTPGGGNLVISGSLDGTVKVWKRCNENEQEPLTFHHGSEVWSLAVLSGTRDNTDVRDDDMRVVSGGVHDTRIRIWSLLSGQLVQSITLPHYPRKVVAIRGSEVSRSVRDQNDTDYFEKFGWRGCERLWEQKIVSGGEDTTVVVTHIETGAVEQILTGHTKALRALDFNINDTGIQIISGSEDATVKIWRTEAEDGNGIWNFSGNVAAMTSTPEHIIVASGKDVMVRHRGAPSGEWVKCFDVIGEGMGAKSVHFLILLRDNRHVIAGNADHPIKMWDLERGECKRVFEGSKSSRPKCAVLLPDGRRFATAGYALSIHVWNVETGKCELAIDNAHPSLVFGLACFSSLDNTDLIVSGSIGAGVVRVWDLGDQSSDGRVTPLLEFKDLGPVHCVATLKSETHDAKLERIVAGGGKDVHVWRLEGERNAVHLFTLSGHLGDVHSLTILPSFGVEWARVASGSIDKSVKVWRLDKGICESTFNGHSSSVECITALGNSVVSGEARNDGVVMEWDIELIGQQPLSSTVWKAYNLDEEAKRNREDVGSKFDWPRMAAIVEQYPSALMARERGHEEMSIMHMAAAGAHSDFLQMFAPKFPAATLIRNSAVKRWKSKLVENPHHNVVVQNESCLKCAMVDKRNDSAHAIIKCWVDHILHPKSKHLHLAQLITLNEILGYADRAPHLVRMFVEGCHLVRAPFAVQSDVLNSDFNNEDGFHVKDDAEHFPSSTWSDKSKGKTPAEAVLAPIPDLLVSGQFLDTCVAVADALNEAKMFENEVVRAVVCYKWQTFGRRLYNLETSLYLILVIVNFVLVLAIKQQYGLNPSGIEARTLSVFSMLMAAFFLFREVMQLILREEDLRTKFEQHFSDVWNLSMVFTHIPVFFASLFILLFPEEKSTRLLMGCAQLPLYLNLLWYLRARRGTGQLVVMIFRIVYGIQHLLLVVGIVIMPFALGFFLCLDVSSGNDPTAPDWVDPEYDGFRSIWLSLLTTFRGALGDFNFENLRQSDNFAILNIAAFVLLFSVTIVILNLLIAIMGDIYGMVKEVEEGFFMKERAIVCLEYEKMLKFSMFGWGVPDPELFKKWLHVLRPAVDNDRDGKGQEWKGIAGRIVNVGANLENKFVSEIGIVKSDYASLKNDIQNLTRQLDQRFAGLQHESERKLDMKLNILVELLSRGTPDQPPKHRRHTLGSSLSKT
jgi:WD40 repeat protein